MADRDEDDDLPEAPKPFWSGVVTFGLVSLPVSLFPASRNGSLRLRMVDTQGAFLARKFFSGDDPTPLDAGDLVRGYEVEKDRFIVIDDDELEALDPKKSREIDLGQFVSLHELNPMYFERAYFLVPEGDTNKAYRLLAKTMEDEERAGIATFVMRGREYLCAILSERGILRVETLRFSDEVRSPDDIGLPQKRPANAAQLKQLAKTIKALQAKQLDPSQLEDQRSLRIAEYAGKKHEAGTDVIQGDKDDEGAEESSSNVIDLMQVLRDRLQGKIAARSDDGPDKHAPRSAAKSDLKAMSKADLYEMAQEMELDGRSAMTKDELIEAIRASNAS